VIETIATEVVMIVNVMMTEGGAAEGCFKARSQLDVVIIS